tara:strand:- start:140 stop:484 length:345 start_codon:yes stop_codon:yes gene_type:complete
MRTTENKRQILEALRGLYDGCEYLEYGPPPFCAADVVALMGSGTVRNTSRTLRLMAEQGLVNSETRMRDQWSAVPKSGHYPRTVICCWSVETMEEDQARTAEWLASADKKERSW